MIMTLSHNSEDIRFPVLDLGAFSFLPCHPQAGLAVVVVVAAAIAIPCSSLFLLTRISLNCYYILKHHKGRESLLVLYLIQTVYYFNVPLSPCPQVASLIICKKVNVRSRGQQ